VAFVPEASFYVGDRPEVPGSVPDSNISTRWRMDLDPVPYKSRSGSSLTFCMSCSLATAGFYRPLNYPAMTNDWDLEPSASGDDETGRTDLPGDGGQSSRITEVSRTTDPCETRDVDIELLDSIEEELNEVELTLARLDEDGP
jgi:hypothetical protein